MDKTLQQYLEENLDLGNIDFAIRAQRNGEDEIVFYIHPTNVNGETADFKVNENTVKNRYSELRPKED